MSADEIPFLLEALEAEPSNWNIRRYLAEHYMRAGDEPTAASLLTTAPNAPDSEDHALFAAQIAARHSVKRAHHILDSFLVHHASSSRVHYLKGRLYQIQGNEDKAKTHFRVASIVNPNIEAEADALLAVAPVQLAGMDLVEPVLLPKIDQATSHVRPMTGPAPAAKPGSAPRPVAFVDESSEDSLGIPAETPDVEPLGPISEPVAVTAVDDEEPEVAPVAVAAISPISPPPGNSQAYAVRNVAELANLEATGPIMSPTKAAEDHDAVVHLMEDDGDGEPDDLLSEIVMRQTAMVAAMSANAGDMVTKPGVIEKKTAGEKVSAVAIAILAHVALIFLLMFAVMAAQPEKPPEIYAAVSNVDSDTDLEKTEIIKPTTQKVSPAAQQMPVMTVAAFSDVAMPSVDVSNVSPITGMSAEQGVDFGSSFGMPGGGAGMSNIPPSMAGRCSMGQRMSRLKESGATTKCEAAVRSALRFLKQNQNEDGSFGKEYPVAMTGLCILAYLGHCETPDSVEFGDTVTRATLFLIENSKSSDHPSGAMLSKGGGKAAYENGIAAYALAEMVTMTKASGASKRIPSLESAMKKGIKAIIEGQGSDGGWVYGYAKGGDGDSSVSGWQFQAMKAAHNSDTNISGLEKALDKGIEYFKAAQAPDGGISYRRSTRTAQAGLGGVGALAFMMWGEEESKEKEMVFDWLNKNRLGKGNVHTYDWYYTMQAYFLEGGEPWKAWNDYAMEKILAAQIDDGSFAKAAGGHGPKDPLTKNIYATTLCTLMLEVYYRYLPTTQKNFGKG